MVKPRIVYRPHPDTTPESELNTFASVYRFILNCHAKKEGGPATALDDAKARSSDDFRADKAILPE